MIISKYNRAPGDGTKPNIGSTAVAGGGSTVDLTPLTEKVAALESEVSQLRLQLNRMQTVMAGLDSRFLSKLGDRSDYAYYLGAVYTDFLQSEMYANGVGFRLSGSATATVDDKYNLIIRDVGWGQVPFSTIQQDDASLVDTDTDEASAQLNETNISIGATHASGYLLVDCGATLTQERCFTEIAKTVKYKVDHTRNNQHFVDPWRDADTDPNGNFILHFGKADNVSIDIRYTFTYAFKHYGNITSGTYRLYIRGTDYANNKTDCFAAATKITTINASGVTVMEDNNGARITSSGVELTTDGGAHWS